MLPSDWSSPTKGAVTAADRKIDAAYNSGTGGAFVAFSDDDWGSTWALNEPESGTRNQGKC